MNASKDVEALRRALGESGGEEQPLVFTSAEAPDPGTPEFWSQSRGLEEFRSLARVVLERAGDAGLLVAVAGGDSDFAERQFCALQIARLLNEAGKRVLLVDGQLDGRGFSRDFDEIESEGLVDLIQYGSSPMATVQPSPILGLWMMGSGSYRPESELEGDALRRALGQLRATHEVVLLPMPTHQPNGFFSEFFVHVDGVVLCVSRSSEGELHEVMSYLRQYHVGLWGAVSYESEDRLAQAAVEAPPVERPEPAAEPAPAPPEVESALPPSSAPAARRHPSAHGARRSSDPSSPMFRRALLAVVVIFVAFLGWWGAAQFRGSSTPESARPSLSDQLARRGEARDGGETVAAGEPVPENPTSPDQGSGSGDEQAAASDEAPGAIATSSPVEPTETTPPRQDPPLTEPQPASSSVANGAEDGEAANSEPAESEVASRVRESEIPSATPAEPESTPLERALRAEPGGGGWSLHVWSFRRTSEAEVGARSLATRGLAPRIIETDLKELGVWYRVVVGRYASRGEALRARSLMAGWPGVENVGLVRVP